MAQDKEQNRRIVWLEERFSTINSEMGDVKTDVAEIKVSVAIIATDVDWLKNNHKTVLMASVGSFFTVIGGVVLFFLTR